MSSQFQIKSLKPDTGLEREDRNHIVRILSRILADEHMICVKTRKYHWNVVGPSFYMLHKLFGEQYDELTVAADRIAERIRAYGMPAIGTLEEFLDYTRLPESPGDYPSADEMLLNLVEDHETMMRNLRQDIQASAEHYHDEGTADLLTSLMQQHQQMAWMLRSSLPDAEL
jgi:starvation-inducible DNA-binding protein